MQCHYLQCIVWPFVTNKWIPQTSQQQIGKLWKEFINGGLCMLFWSFWISLKSSGIYW